MTPCSWETHSAGGIVTSDSCAISQTFDGGLEQWLAHGSGVIWAAFQEQKTCLPMVLEVVWNRLIFNRQRVADTQPNCAHLPKRKKLIVSQSFIQVFLGHLKLGLSPRSITFAAGECLSSQTYYNFQCLKMIPHARSFCFFGVKMADLRRMRFWRTRVACLRLSLAWKAWTGVGRAFEEIRGNAWLNNFKVGFEEMQVPGDFTRGCGWRPRFGCHLHIIDCPPCLWACRRPHLDTAQRHPEARGPRGHSSEWDSLVWRRRRQIRRLPSLFSRLGFGWWFGFGLA